MMSDLVRVLLSVCLVVFAPAAVIHAAPPDKCETWPHCDDGGGGDGGGSSNQITGTEGPDGGTLDAGPSCSEGDLTGTDGDDVIDGLGGDDCLDGGLGDDRLHGGSGNDVVIGGRGADTLQSGPGNDTLLGGDDNDRILSGGGCDVIDGGADGGVGLEDWISYNTDQMQIVVNFSDYPVSAGTEGSPVAAAAGTIVDAMSCGNNACALHALGCNVGTVTGVEKVTLTPNNDYVFGGDADEFFGGGRGNDYIHGGPGNDFIGADRGDDVVVGGLGSDQLRGAEHDDEFRFSVSDFAAGDADVIEDFNGKADCINFIGFGVIATDFDTSSNHGGKGKNDTVISVLGGIATITVWDVSLGPSDIGCP